MRSALRKYPDGELRAVDAHRLTRDLVIESDLIAVIVSDEFLPRTYARRYSLLAPGAPPSAGATNNPAAGYPL